MFAVEGETITLASSAQGGGNARIRLFDPEGNVVVSSTSEGSISNRTAEKAGPRLRDQTGGDGYTPIYHTVEKTGIYRVEFAGRGDDTPSTTVAADANWTQANNSAIAAWDVSVINTENSGFITGRVYTTVLSLSNGASSPNSDGFRGLIYVLTKDGYIYQVDNNGNNGMHFTFFVNNLGFVDEETQEPLYKSLSTTNINQLRDKVHNPNEADNDTHITHKLFYTMPAEDLPQTASGAVPGEGPYPRLT